MEGGAGRSEWSEEMYSSGWDEGGQTLVQRSERQFESRAGEWS